MISQLYNDTVNVYRTVAKDDGYGGTIEELRLVCEGVKCRLSQKSLHSTSNDIVRSSTQEFKLFAAVNIDIKQNDRLKVFRGGKDVYHFLAGQPFKYYDLIPHAEIVLSEVIENERD